MAIARYVYAENDADWIDTAAARIEKGDKGAIHVSLTEWTTSAESSVAAGSYFEIAGSGYYVTGDTAVTGSEATGVNNIYATGATTAASIAYSTDVPVWRDDHQGWYQTAASSVRAIASVHFDGGTTYSQKKVYSNNYTLTDRYGNEVVAMQVETKYAAIGKTIGTSTSTVVNVAGFSWIPDAILNYSVSAGTTDNKGTDIIGYGGNENNGVMNVSGISLGTTVGITILNVTGATLYLEHAMITAAKTS